MSKLLNVETDRVDAVEDPANGRGFLILKSESGDAAAKLAQVTEVVKSAGETLAAFADAGIELPTELHEKFTALAKQLELGEEVVFKSVEAPAATEDATEAEGEGFTFKSADEAAELIFKAVEKALPGALDQLVEKERLEKSSGTGEGTRIESRQAEGQDRLEKNAGSKKEFGEGMFANVL